MAKKSDYVLFKLDIDSGPVEQGTVDFLLDDANDEIEYIDEFLWEHHVDNYVRRRARRENEKMRSEATIKS